MQRSQELSACIKKIVFRKPLESESTFAFYIAVTDDEQGVKGSTRENLENGYHYRFFGRWENHPKHGRQFAFTSAVREVPVSEDAVVKTLNKVCPNIGMVRAIAIWDRFKERSVDIVADHPEQLEGILNAEQAKQASAAVGLLRNRLHATVELMGLLADRGFPSRTVDEIIDRAGTDAAHLIRDNPFKLLEWNLFGCGFKRCDKLYLDMSLPPSSPMRQAYAVSYGIRKDSDGSVWLPLPSASEILRKYIASARINPLRAVQYGIKRGMLRVVAHDKKRWIANAREASHEANVCERLLAIGVSDARWPHKINGISDHQQKAWLNIADRGCKVCVLAGTPGTGKTYTTGCVMKTILDSGIWSIADMVMVAPTGKAANRLTQAIRNQDISSVTARTIHSVLGWQGSSFIFNDKNPLPYRLVVVDEASMVANNLFAALLRACRNDTHILVVGDPNQLPPVEDGAPLRDIIASGMFPVAMLTELQRNSGAAVIACRDIKDRAKAIRTYTFPEWQKKPENNIVHIPAKDAETTIAKIVRLYNHLTNHGYHPLDDIQVITPLNAKGHLCKDALNRGLQQVLNTPATADRVGALNKGDKCICLKNGQYSSQVWDTHLHKWLQPTDDDGNPMKVQCFNGEIGTVLFVNPENKTAVVRLPFPVRHVLAITGKSSNVDDKRRKKDQDENNADNENEETFGSWDLAYAVTGHKMQGSECKAIIIPIDFYRGADFVTSCEWWYTSISRLRTVVFLVGDMRIFDRQRQRRVLPRRKTLLTEMLKGEEIKVLGKDELS